MKADNHTHIVRKTIPPNTASYGEAILLLLTIPVIAGVASAFWVNLRLVSIILLCLLSAILFCIHRAQYRWSFHCSLCGHALGEPSRNRHAVPAISLCPNCGAVLHTCKGESSHRTSANMHSPSDLGTDGR